MEPCKIRRTTKPRTHAPGLEGKEISSPSSRGRKMSLTSPLIDQASATVRLFFAAIEVIKRYGNSQKSSRFWNFFKAEVVRKKRGDA